MSTWQVWAAFALHGLKWFSIAVGTTLFGVATTNAGVIAIDRRMRCRRSPAVAEVGPDVGLAGLD